MADPIQWVLVGTFLITALAVFVYVGRRTSLAYMTEGRVMLRAGSEYAETIRNLARENPDFLPSIKILRENVSTSNQRPWSLRRFLKKCDSILKRGKTNEKEFQKLLRRYDKIQHLLGSETYVK